MWTKSFKDELEKLSANHSTDLLFDALEQEDIKLYKKYLEAVADEKANLRPMIAWPAIGAVLGTAAGLAGSRGYPGSALELGAFGLGAGAVSGLVPGAYSTWDLRKKQKEAQVLKARGFPRAEVKKMFEKDLQDYKDGFL